MQQKAEQDAALKKQQRAQYGAAGGFDDSLWENWGSGRSTPGPSLRPAGVPPDVGASNGNGVADEDDFLATFNVPTQKHPGATATEPEMKCGLSFPEQRPTAINEYHSEFADDEDDDPFGLNQLKSTTPHITQAPPAHESDDDILGLLGQPVPSLPKVETQIRGSPAESGTEAYGDPRDRAIAELVDMGFPADKAREALETTEDGTDVSAAVSYLLQKAHAEARAQKRPRRRSTDLSHGRDSRFNPGQATIERNQGDEETRRQNARRQRAEKASGAVEKDPAQLAAELGNNFLRTAGSLWKSGAKKVQQAVQDLNSDSDSSQPRWMREASSYSGNPRVTRHEDEPVARRRRTSSDNKVDDPRTDEARMLDSDQGQPPKRPPRSGPDARFDSSVDSSRDHSPAIPSRLREDVPVAPAYLRQQQVSVPSNPRSALNRQTIEEQASQAYVSSARRRKPQVQPRQPASDPDLLGSRPNAPFKPTTAEPSRPPKLSTPFVVRSKAPARTIPSVSSIAMKASNDHRESGTSHFRRGDYSAAHESYTTALCHLPKTHPMAIVLLTNRALTALKTGEPKAAITDADSAIQIIGISNGESETVSLGDNEQPKPMREFYGKALMRKAEALEQMEKWADAAAVWKEAVEGGHGGATSIQGRMRAEKAANPQQTKPRPPPPKKPTPSSNSSATAGPSGRPAVNHAASTAAVKRLRAANAAAEKADDERFALADSVDARVSAWKGGKADNLRALLSSLDMVLWPEAQWKKIGMAELVLPAKVKVQYMKGIAKVHPDKVSSDSGGQNNPPPFPPLPSPSSPRGLFFLSWYVGGVLTPIPSQQIPADATTEQRMIAGAVFSTLNEAWDKFKVENGL